ncbi:hypothetical protein L207DRAFT_300657 [Hyaloscypha variabilis F]|uniref:Methyltransferase domain-containing protein n=1 Tax=Hyaloscypha variabilis (strain UAMH 11265 / GT02V1 / F) TaxID=1149755 RepID=A0A2J6RYJ9_HYAVF|nr:hypothetical protein L207DRAFT_300657 [Hyaloscypha variabilis F]
MPLIFTTPTGEVFELTPETLPSHILHSIMLTDTYNPADFKPLAPEMNLPIRPLPKSGGPGPLDGTTEAATATPSPSSTPTEQSPHRQSCGSASPLIEILNPDELAHKNAPNPRRAATTPVTSPIRPGRRDGTRPRSLVKVAMAYNEYGELMEEIKLQHHPTPDELSITQLLRVIRKKFHHTLREKITKIVAPRGDGKGIAPLEDELLARRLTWCFDFRPVSPSSSTESPDDGGAMPVYSGPSRVLDIGCSDGKWYHSFKKEQPTWIVEGVDDTDHWSCIDKDLVVRDFMDSHGAVSPTDYFGHMNSKQESPEFTMRNINSLRSHQKPMLHNLYEFIRAREIFDRVESYKTFLEDIRLLLKPDGIVEFIEIDPRPRFILDEKKREEVNYKLERKSGAQTDWTDDIQDRFKNPLDAELATNVPGWSGRVEQRLKAILRPLDGVAAANLKAWLQGAGFCEVTEIVIRIPVGGNTLSGQHLKEFLLYQISLENMIPKLRDKLPGVELAELENGSYFLNVHIVTGRKPALPRPGDLLKNGTRQYMTASKYDAMARNDAKLSWKRFDLEGKLSSMMKNLTTLPGAPDSRTVTLGTFDDELFKLPSAQSEGKGPFMLHLL